MQLVPPEAYSWHMIIVSPDLIILVFFRFALQIMNQRLYEVKKHVHLLKAANSCVLLQYCLHYLDGHLLR